MGLISLPCRVGFVGCKVRAAKACSTASAQSHTDCGGLAALEGLQVMGSDQHQGARYEAWLSRLVSVGERAESAKQGDEPELIRSLIEILDTMPEVLASIGYRPIDPERTDWLLGNAVYDELAMGLIPDHISYTLSYSRSEGFLGIFQVDASNVEGRAKGGSFALVAISGIAQAIYEHWCAIDG